MEMQINGQKILQIETFLILSHMVYYQSQQYEDYIITL